MSDDFTIESVPLYTNLDRITKGLAALGLGPTDPIRPEQLFPFDQWHYHGTDAIRTAAERLGIASASQVLDIGSGVDGPARFLAHTTGCDVTALELQPKLHAIGVDLTQRCGLDERVTHLCGDALNHPLPDGTFDAAVSWLAIHHIPNGRAFALDLLGRYGPEAVVTLRICACAPHSLPMISLMCRTSCLVLPLPA